MLTTPQKVLLTLGYGANYDASYTLSITNLPTVIGDRIDALMTSLDAIDSALLAAPLDGMATKVDKLEVSYSQYTNLLKKEGSRILHEISQLCLVAVNYDRYLQKRPGTNAPSQYSVVSYW